MTSIKVGDTVRINERYGEDLEEVGDNAVGTEFKVARVVQPTWNPYEDLGEFYVEGDPENWGVWEVHIEKVEEGA